MQYPGINNTIVQTNSDSQEFRTQDSFISSLKYYRRISTLKLSDIIGVERSTYDDHLNYDKDVNAFYVCRKMYKIMKDVIEIYNANYVLEYFNKHNYQYPKLSKYGCQLDGLAVDEKYKSGDIDGHKYEFRKWIVLSIKYEESLARIVSEEDSKNCLSKVKVNDAQSSDVQKLRDDINTIIETNIDAVKQFVRDNRKYTVTQSNFNADDFYTKEQIMAKYDLTEEQVDAIIKKFKNDTLALVDGVLVHDMNDDE